MNVVKEVLATLLLIVILAFTIAGELERRQETASLSAELRQFMSVGPRFPLQYGLGLCERVRNLEVREGISNPIDCDAIRHAVIER